MGAAALVARSELRRLKGTVLLLVVIVALVSGAVFTAAAGARRTSTVLDRFVEATGMPDAMVGLARPRVASDNEAVLRLAASLGEVDGVEAVVPVQGIPIVGQTEEDMVLMTGPDERYREARSPMILEGRLPRDNALDEVALNESSATELGLAVGDVFVAPTTTVDSGEALFDGALDGFVTDGPVLELDVVGIFRDEASFQIGSSLPLGLLSPAVSDLFGDVAAFATFFQLSGDASVIDIDQGLRLIRAEAPDAELFGDVRDTDLVSAATAFDAIATGLYLFAAVAAVAGLIAVGQAVARQVSLSEAATRATRSLGMSRASAAVSLAIPVAVGTGAGVVVGAVVALLLSPRFPISTARLAEVDPGVRPDWPVYLVGMATVAAVVVAWGLVAAWRQTRLLATPQVSSGLRWRRLRRALPPPAAVGFASVAGFGPRRGVRPASALLGAVIGLAGVSGIAVFTVSQHDAAGDPARYGWTWDSSPDLSAEDPMPVVEQLAADPRLDGVGGLYCDPMEVGGSFESVCALLVADGVFELTYLDGRAPASPSEVAVALETKDRLGVGLGDEVTVTGESGQDVTLAVVGTVISPVLADDPARGLVVDLDTFEELADEFYNRDLILTYAGGQDRTALEAELDSDYPLEFSVYAYPAPPERLSELGQIRPTLVALAFFMAALAVLGLGHFLLLSTRRGRGELAVLKSVGFVRRQIRGVVSAQALTVALVGLVVGVPIGAVVGRWVWISAVDEVGIVDTPTMPWGVWSLMAVCSLLGALVVSAIPGRLATRRSPSEALRAE